VTLPCRFSPQAEADPQEIALFIARDNPAAAIRFTEELRRRCRNAAAFPKAWPLRESFVPGIRVLVYRNHVALLTETSEAVVVERVLHAARIRRR
jgi:toxin ParE1/3/4